MTIKTVNSVIPAQKVNMGGHYLDQPLPLPQLEYADPFLLIHHWKDVLPGDQNPRDIGVGPHPHRGFSPVTFVFEGDVSHRDSLGNYAVVGAGGTQWMFAGRGITHSERQSKAFAQKGGPIEFIQFWVNAPRSSKMSQPTYLPISKEDTPTYREEGIEVAIVAGAYKDMKGIAPTQSPQTLLRVNMKSNHRHQFTIPASYTTLIYLLDGELIINNKVEATAKDMIEMKSDGTEFTIETKKDTRFIILSGEPLNEPMTSAGPFVMNTDQEIMEAYRDARMGKMGILIEEFE
jgi:hypothetical protein